MSENKEEKKTQAPPKPWLLKKVDAINEAIDENRNVKEIGDLFEELLEGLTSERYNFNDPEGKKYSEYLEIKRKPIGYIFFCKCLKIVIGINKENSYSQNLSKELWTRWGNYRLRKTINNLKEVDDFVSFLFQFLRPTVIQNLYEAVEKLEWNFDKLHRVLGEIYRNNPNILENVATILEKVDVKSWLLANCGKSLRAQAEILRIKPDLKKEVKEELEEDTLKPFERKVEAAQEDIAESVENAQKTITNLKESTERKLRDSEARFIQVIGIFAAIIAFIVTIVPTAVRLGGASIPIALAGLAIVTAGIVILLAMIFGKDERRKSLSKGLTGIIIAFTLWLTLTVVLAFVEPNVLRPPPDPVRVDTLYIHTVETTPPPTPSIKEGD
ncbi:MnhB domain-containing protein [candidate division WOR-3 bacterium]|nr:MnhB domain-containing protein [candidate division WOR-3 bacterium]